MLLGVYPARSWIGSYEWLLGVSTQISLIGLALLAFLCTTNFASGHWLVRIFIWGSLPVLLYGVAQYFGLDPIPWARWGDGGAVMATLGNQNYFGGYLALLLPLTLSEWFVSENRLGRAALMVLVIGQAFCLIATGSKGAMLATVIACLLLLWWPRRFVWWQTAAALAAVVAVSMIATMLIALQGDALGDVAVGATRREVRPFTWESAYRAVAARPLFGWGSSSFDLTLAENASAGFRKRIMPLDRVMDRAHNLWLELAVESGLPGLGLWLAMTAAAGHAVLTSAERQSDLKTKTLLLGGVASLFGYMIYQVVNPSDLGTVSVFWWLVGWTLGSSFAVRVEDDAPPLKLENVKFVLQMLWLVAVFGFGYGAWQWVVN
jgi:putative inorganic carbon (HCO3(-)) transporter